MIGRTLLALAGAAGLVLALLGASLTTPAIAYAAQGTPCAEATDAELEEIAQGWIGMYNTHDPSIIDEIVSPEIAHQPEGDGSLSVLDDLKARQQALLDAFPDIQATINVILTDAPYAVVQWTATGTNTGALGGTEPTGATVTWDGIHMFRVDCGKVVQSWAYIDQLGFLQQGGPLSGDVATEASAAMTDTGGTPAACPAATEAEITRLLETWWSDGWTGDLVALEEITTDDVVHHWATGPDSAGAEAQAERIGGWTGAMPDMRYTWGDIVIDGEYAAGVWQGTGTQTGEYMGNPATGKSAAWGGMNVFRIECGQIAEVWSEMDVLSFRAQLAPDEAATPAP